MSEPFPNIKSIIVKVITDKPVRKTPYQVKGLFMKQYGDEPIIPMLDGSYRNKFLYPRVQVKILDEQIYIIGIHEGVEPVVSIIEKLNILDFGNITFKINDCDVDTQNEQFIPTTHLLRYRFTTPWVALNHMTGGRYKFLTNQEKPSFLNRLLGQNIIFLAKEVGVNIEDDIYTKVKLASLFPKPVDDNKWGAFMGEFKTNFIFPNYIGLGNGITRGYGSIYGLFNHNGEDKLKEDSNIQEINLDDEKGLEVISATDVPKPKRHKRRPKNFKKKRKNKSKKFFNQTNKNNKKKHKKNYQNSGRRFSKDFDIEDDNKKHKSHDENSDDSKFNTEKHHKQQHKF